MSEPNFPNDQLELVQKLRNDVRQMLDYEWLVEVADFAVVACNKGRNIKLHITRDRTGVDVVLFGSLDNNELYPFEDLAVYMNKITMDKLLGLALKDIDELPEPAFKLKEMLELITTECTHLTLNDNQRKKLQSIGRKFATESGLFDT